MEEQKTKNNNKKEFFEWLDVVVTSVLAVVLIFTFLFRIVSIDGDSMKNTLINGERVVISNLFYTPKNGDIVVAMIDDSATVKRFYKEKGRYRLQPENSEMEPIITDEVSILGKVVASLRYY